MAAPVVLSLARRRQQPAGRRQPWRRGARSCKAPLRQAGDRRPGRRRRPGRAPSLHPLHLHCPPLPRRDHRAFHAVHNPLNSQQPPVRAPAVTRSGSTQSPHRPQPLRSRGGGRPPPLGGGRPPPQQKPGPPSPPVASLTAPRNPGVTSSRHPPPAAAPRRHLPSHCRCCCHRRRHRHCQTAAASTTARRQALERVRAHSRGPPPALRPR